MAIRWEKLASPMRRMQVDARDNWRKGVGRGDMEFAAIVQDKGLRMNQEWKS